LADYTVREYEAHRRALLTCAGRRGLELGEEHVHALAWALMIEARLRAHGIDLLTSDLARLLLALGLSLAEIDAATATTEA
jgi:hypothetical protein